MTEPQPYSDDEIRDVDWRRGSFRYGQAEIDRLLATITADRARYCRLEEDHRSYAADAIAIINDYQARIRQLEDDLAARDAEVGAGSPKPETDTP